MTIEGEASRRELGEVITVDGAGELGEAGHRELAVDGAGERGERPVCDDINGFRILLYSYGEFRSAAVVGLALAEVER